MENQTVKLLRTDATNPAFRELVALLDAELAERDGPQHGFYHQFNGLEGLDRVVLADHDGQWVACGAMKEFGEDALEVKRMYTRVPFRGQGLAGAVLEELDRWAAEAGFIRLVLETGRRQPEAISFYGKHGFQKIENYGPYVGVANSVCFEKSL